MEKDPSGLSSSDLELRSRIRELEHKKVSILQERLRLDRQLQNIEEEQHRMYVLSTLSLL